MTDSLTLLQLLFLALMVGGCNREMPTDALAVAAAPARGVMTVSVSGLRAGAPAPIMVTGPSEYRRAISSSIRLDSLVVGDYVLRAGGTTDAGESYSPTVDSQAVHISSGSAPNVQVQYVKVARPASTDLPAHPRVWMTPARVTQLRTQAAANTVRWQKVKAVADAQLAVGAVASGATLPALCLAYLATGNTAYATRAGVVLVAKTDSAALVALRGDDAYPYRGLADITSGLDWCYAGLTVAQRQRTATWLMDAADWVWPESNPARRGAWAVTSVGNNYYWGFMQTGPAALAAAGDDLGTGAISGTDRATYHQELVLQHWTAAAVPFFTGDAAGGASLEGTGYDISSSVALVADAFQTAGGALTTPWLAQAVQWHLQYTMPGGLYFAPLGDQARVSNAPMYIYNREAVLTTMAAANAGSLLQAQTQRWLTLIGQVPYSLSTGGLLANELLYYDPNAPIAADLSGLPKSYYASGAGDFVSRQSWTDPNATTWVFHSGPAPDHMARDANDLMIWKGSFWISAGANIYSHSGIVQATSAFNYLTVGGAGQALYGGNRGAIIGTPSASDTLVVVRGQAKDTYGYPPGSYGGRTVTDATRAVVYLPQQDVFVIVDRATVKDSTQAKVWRWHSLNPATINGNTFTLANPAGDQRCVGNVLLPTDAVLGSQPMQYGATPGVTTSSAVTVTLPTGRASDVVVTVLQCTNAAQATAEITANQAIVTIGIHRVTVPLDEAQAVGFETAAIISDR